LLQLLIICFINYDEKEKRSQNNQSTCWLCLKLELLIPCGSRICRPCRGTLDSYVTFGNNTIVCVNSLEDDV
jgi:hypothetical protein